MLRSLRKNVEQVEGMCSSVFSYPGATRSVVFPELHVGAVSVGGAEMGYKGSREDAGCGEFDDVDI